MKKKKNIISRISIDPSEPAYQILEPMPDSTSRRLRIRALLYAGALAEFSALNGPRSQQMESPALPSSPNSNGHTEAATQSPPARSDIELDIGGLASFCDK
jgi:hypothetical protein